MIARNRIGLVLLGAAMMTGCGEDASSDSEGDNPPQREVPSFPSMEPMTWEEWKRQQGPIRDDAVVDSPLGYARFGPAPNRQRWRPADFLPEEALEADHVDICELPLANRRELGAVWTWRWRKTLPDRVSTSVSRDEAERIARRYAEQGVVQAQMMMGEFHEPGDGALADPGPATQRTLRWLEKAAASGTGEAMVRLGGYQFQILNAAGAEYPGRNEAPMTDFRWDELLYWDWRAAKRFHLGALNHMDGALLNYTWKAWEAAGDGHPERLQYRAAIREYKWARLNDMIRTLTAGNTNDYTRLAHDVLDNWPEQLTLARRALAEYEVGEFIRNNKQALAAYRLPFGCPDRRWLYPEAPPFDWQTLNRELARYGVEVEPAGNRWTVREQWPPAD